MTAPETTAEKIDQWLVRTAANELRGPYCKEALIQQIREGQLGLQDEVCQANHYWIYLDEREEVIKQLGIEIPHSSPHEDEEVTDTQTQTLTQEVPASLLTSEKRDEPPLDEDEEIEIPDLPEQDASENTAVLSNRALREFQPRGTPAKPGSVEPSTPWMQQASVVGGDKKPVLWRMIVIGLVVLILGSVGLLVFLLEKSG